MTSVPPAAAALQAENVRVRIGGQILLQEVSCRVRPGEIVAVLGPNGAGKSTLVRLLSGEIAPDGGTVSIDGRDLRGCPALPLARRRAVLPQSSALAFPFPVEDVVMMGRAPHVAGTESDRDREIVRDAMRQTDVAHLAARNYLTLSGGEKQRVHLARVLAQLAGVAGARYLLLDEPVSSLDMAHQHACLNLARVLAGQGAGVLAVLHDLNLAAMYADAVLLLHRGRQVACGPPGALLTEERIAEVFGQRVAVLRHPHRDCPLIVPV